MCDGRRMVLTVLRDEETTPGRVECHAHRTFTIPVLRRFQLKLVAPSSQSSHLRKTLCKKDQRVSEGSPSSGVNESFLPWMNNSVGEK